MAKRIGCDLAVRLQRDENAELAEAVGNSIVDKAGQYLSKIGERLILLKSTGLAAVAMLVSYAYGRAN
ncbi:hypothetical protein, partial [Rhizobium leguminosarum]|uniref:hypothetical protein n=1 Tax=Rhizobium leguminosarum TaxID=384 RepID=UPI003F94E585